MKSGLQFFTIIFPYFIFLFISFLYKKNSCSFILENFCNFSPNQLEITNKFVLFHFGLFDLTFSFTFSGKKIWVIFIYRLFGSRECWVKISEKFVGGNLEKFSSKFPKSRKTYNTPPPKLIVTKIASILFIHSNTKDFRKLKLFSNAFSRYFFSETNFH